MWMHETQLRLVEGKDKVYGQGVKWDWACVYSHSATSLLLVAQIMHVMQHLNVPKMQNCHAQIGCENVKLMLTFSLFILKL